MSNVDVQVKDVNLIKSYNSSYKTIMDEISHHLDDVCKKTEIKFEEILRVKKDIQKRRQELDSEIRSAKNEREYAYTCGHYETRHYSDGRVTKEFVPDYEYINRCTDRCDHLADVSHQLNSCEEFIQNKFMKCQQLVDLIINETKRTKVNLLNFKERGSIFLGLVERYIDEYKDNNLDV